VRIPFPETKVHVTNETSLGASFRLVERGLRFESRPFVEKVKGELGLKATYREVIEADGTYALREAAQTYGLKFAAESEALRSKSTVFWDETVDEVRA
jgi:nitric oxide synthase oxygenase domain/subunit